MIRRPSPSDSRVAARMLLGLCFAAISADVCSGTPHVEQLMSTNLTTSHDMLYCSASCTCSGVQQFVDCETNPPAGYIPKTPGESCATAQGDCSSLHITCTSSGMQCSSDIGTSFGDVGALLFIVAGISAAVVCFKSLLTSICSEDSRPSQRVVYVNQRDTPVPATPVHTRVQHSGNFCSQCGTTAAKGMQFCSNCGKRLGSE